MIVIDSSGWIEYFIDGVNAERFYRHMKEPQEVVTPSIIIYEVYKKLKRDRSEQDALEAIAQISKTKIVPLSEEMALTAADVSLEYNLAMADAIIYATAKEHNCKIITMDKDFKKLPNATVVQ